jgi:hypothetical protein
MATPRGEHRVRRPRMTYRVTPQKGDLYGVEMIGPTGKRSLIEDFRHQAAANAWIVQNYADATRSKGSGTRKTGER